MKRVVVFSALLVSSFMLVSLLGCLNIVYVPFLAGQGEEAGTAVVANDNVDLYVALVLNDPWELGVPPVTHVAIGTEAYTDEAGVNWVEGIPQNNAGNPKVSQFPYELEEDEEQPGLYVLIVSLDELEVNLDDWVYVAVHAEVYNTDDIVGTDDDGNPIYREESAWADGDQFNSGKSWAMYVPHQVLDP